MLDRETITKYQLVILLIYNLFRKNSVNFYSLFKIIRAEDTGKLSSTTTINIKVTDINDRNPEFVGHPYNFSVKEGVQNTTVGFVQAIDTDDGINALVTYSIPANIPFNIDNETGEIITTSALDYEKQKVKYFFK